MNVLIVAAIVVGVLALIGTIIVVAIALKLEKKRSEALQAAAGADPKRQPSALPLRPHQLLERRLVAEG